MWPVWIAVVVLCGLTWQSQESVVSAASTATAARSVAGQMRFGATGYFSTAQSNGRWCLVTPDGRPFYALAVDHVSSVPDYDETTGKCPYCETITSEYSNTASWATATVSRLRSWGFNSVGAFSDYSTFAPDMPYTDLLSMASGSDWFAPSFVTHAYAVAASQVAPLANSRNLIGWYTDSELHWGPDSRSTNVVLDDYLALPPGSPGLAVAQHYVGNPNGFVYALATRYFQVTTAAVRKYDPHHLILGVKAPVQLIQPQLLEAARPYVNVFSVDDYALAPGLEALIQKYAPQYIDPTPDLSNIEAIVKKPLLIGEYGFRAADSGLPNTYPPIFPTFATQADRAAAYKAFVDTMYASPWVVGDSWFEYVDEPAGGREWDGENNNWGLVSVGNVAYLPVVDTAIQLHQLAPDVLVSPGRRCDSWTGASPSKPATCNAWIGSGPPTGGPAPTPGSPFPSAPPTSPVRGGMTYRLVERDGAGHYVRDGRRCVPSYSTVARIFSGGGSF